MRGQPGKRYFIAIALLAALTAGTYALLARTVANADAESEALARIAEIRLQIAEATGLADAMLDELALTTDSNRLERLRGRLRELAGGIEQDIASLREPPDPLAWLPAILYSRPDAGPAPTLSPGTFLGLIEHIATLSAPDRFMRSALGEALAPYRHGTSDLQTALDRAAAQLVETARLHRGELRDLHRGALFLIIAVALGQGLWVFQPLWRELNRAHREARFLSHHDSLTTLLNRHQFTSLLAERIAAVEAGEAGFALIHLDLDRFKPLNLRFGHEAADRVLQVVGQRLLGTLGPEDAGARLNGDQFMLLLAGEIGRDGLLARAAALQRRIAAPIALDGGEVTISAGLGIARCPVDARRADALLDQAELAIREAKAAGTAGLRMVTPEQRRAHRAERALEAELGEALTTGDIHVVFQPQVDLATDGHAGFEVLVRWRHPQRGLLGPGVFLPLVQRSGLMSRLTDHVADAACRQFSDWLTAGFEPGTLALNLPEAVLVGRDGALRLLELLQSHKLAPARLVGEVTESVTLGRDGARVSEALEILRAGGIAISIDDFGTGYASLTHLRSMPFDELKLDRDFVHGIGRAAGDEVIARTVLDLARGLGRPVVAEGVETEQQERFLARYGCVRAQGFRYARPLAAEAAARYLATRPHAPAAGRHDSPAHATINAAINP